MRPFDMDAEEFRRHGYAAVDWIAEYLKDTRDYPVAGAVKPGELAASLPRSAPESGEPVEQILADFDRQIVPALTHWNHPSFFAYFPASASAAGILGEMLAAGVNVNGMVWRSCPASVELETVVLGWLRQWLGLPESFFGMIHDTASTSTLHAIAAARVVADPGLREDGARGGMVMYCSEHAHSSIEKGALSLGLGRKNVRKIGVDGEYRMKPAELARRVKEDRAAGLTPFIVVSTAGTTSVASVDPVAEVQRVAGEEGLWHHVDAAYGGSAAILERMKWMLEGAGEADSLVVNPHKWLFTPVDFSAFYCRRPEALKEAFSLVPAYLKTAEDGVAVNYMDHGIPLGRRFRALKLWFVMRWFGRAKVEQILGSHLDWTQRLKERIEADGRFEVCAPVHLSLICFRMKSDDEANRRLLDAVNDSGAAFLSGNVLDGRFVLRMAIGNIATTWADIEGVWAKISGLAGAD